MPLSYPRTPGLIVIAKVDKPIYNKGDIFLLHPTQPTHVDTIHVVNPNHKVDIYTGSNFEPLSHNQKFNPFDLSSLVTWANAQSPVLLILFAEDLTNYTLPSYTATAPTLTEPTRSTSRLDSSLFDLSSRTTLDTFLKGKKLE